MGCDIHCRTEKQIEGKWSRVGRAGFWRNYGLFGFLANVRNYSAVPPISEPRGFPDDASKSVRLDYESWSSDAHSASWLTVAELTAFNYDTPMEDRRVTRQLAPNYFDGGCTAEPGCGRQTTYREFLGSKYFDELRRIEQSGAERIVFWFDN